MPSWDSDDGLGQFLWLPKSMKKRLGGQRLRDEAPGSHRFTPETPCGGSEGVGQFVSLYLSMKNGSDYNFSIMKLPVHDGTHVDAPGHMFPCGHS
ncbi:cyclase family protein [Actinidia rufa]|uniref:Cyclase family protein n=1 Tax=Actinidia rufa TaxID=165716 RepID=A0A7J0DQC6_9ERIC|nr:cyclase family protein [Actinidia rufa]